MAIRLEDFDTFVHWFREELAGKCIDFHDLFASDLPYGNIDLLCVDRDIFLVRLEDLLLIEDRISLLLLDADFLGEPVDQLVHDPLGRLLLPDVGIADFCTPGNLGILDKFAIEVDLYAVNGVDRPPPVRIERDTPVLVDLLARALVMEEEIWYEAEFCRSLYAAGPDGGLLGDFYREMGDGNPRWFFFFRSGSCPCQLFCFGGSQVQCELAV